MALLGSEVALNYYYYFSSHQHATITGHHSAKDYDITSCLNPLALD